MIGNPNSGKSSLFNALTGQHQAVGHWAGVTVERCGADFTYPEAGRTSTLQKRAVHLVDLPGIYSLIIDQEENALDARITHQELLVGPISGIVNVIDACYLERHLYLTLQLLELGFPMVVVVTMLDVAKQRGIEVDLTLLSERLGCPVMPVNSVSHEGIEQLKKQLAISDLCSPLAPELPLPKMMEAAEKQLFSKFSMHETWSEHRRLWSGDRRLYHALPDTLKTQFLEISRTILSQCGEEPDILFAQARYQLIHQWVQEVVKKSTIGRHTWTRRLDSLALHQVLGIPIFFGIMYLLFYFATQSGSLFQDFFSQVSQLVFFDMGSYVLQGLTLPPFLQTTLTQGIGLGLTTVLSFVPVLTAMYSALAFLENSGYLARAAVVMDRTMRVLGLPGKAFIPLIIGFGCNVSGVLATRTLERWQERLLTILMVPFMSCSARLVIFAVFTSAFFQTEGTNIVFSLYVIGVAVAILTALLLRKTILPTPAYSVVQELPPYRWPSLAFIGRQTWRRLIHFIFRAGRLILPVCLLLTLLHSLTWEGKIADSPQETVVASLGQKVTPLLSPLGIEENNWPAAVGLLSGVLAKEVVISSLNLLYSEQELPVPLPPSAWSQQWHSVVQTLISRFQTIFGLSSFTASENSSSSVSQELSRHFQGAEGAYAYLLFILLYFPCISTMAVIRKETSTKWAAFSMLWSLFIAYGIATVFYQVATVNLHPWETSAWIFSLLGVWFGLIALLRRITLKMMGQNSAARN